MQNFQHLFLKHSTDLQNTNIHADASKGTTMILC